METTMISEAARLPSRLRNAVATASTAATAASITKRTRSIRMASGR